MSIQSEVTARIIAELEKGAAPWVRPWQTQGEARNAFTNRPYSGINRLLLGITPGGPRFATFKQWSEAGARVKKGEHGTRIVFYKALTKEDENGEEQHFAMLRQFVVFGQHQVEGIEFPADHTAPEHERLAHCEATIARTGATIQHGGDVACYSPGPDIVRLPNMGAFKDAASYYATAFHELGHWTGAKHRLNRDLGGKFGASRYAFEELVAELSAATLCAQHGIDGDLRHAGYIGNWLECLRENQNAIFKAAALAEKAAAYVNACTEQLAAA